MRKKVRNNKTILASILALGCLTAASVGFSSWVIAAQNTDAASNVKVTVADVEDHRFKVEASSNSTIKLGPSTPGKYISYSESASEEVLDFSFSLTFTANTANDGEAFDFTFLGNQSFNIKFSFTDTINDAKNEYIEFPPEKTTIGTISNSGFSPSSSDATTDPKNSNVITYNGRLSWGSYFDNKNPSELDDSTKFDSYIAGLKHLKERLKDNAVFEITAYIEKAA